MKKKLILFLLLPLLASSIFALSRRNIKKINNSNRNFASVINKYIENSGHIVYRNPSTYLKVDWDEVDWCFWEYESGKGIYAVYVPNLYGGNYVIFIGYDGSDITDTYTILEK